MFLLDGRLLRPCGLRLRLICFQQMVYFLAGLPFGKILSKNSNKSLRWAYSSANFAEPNFNIYRLSITLSDIGTTELRYISLISGHEKSFNCSYALPSLYIYKAAGSVTVIRGDNGTFSVLCLYAILRLIDCFAESRCFLVSD